MAACDKNTIADKGVVVDGDDDGDGEEASWQARCSKDIIWVLC